ncbi:MAG: efflux RND transporter periplasmic adaptor subunit [Proteobacteria bacterium]|nr:efflux RND transporter periplasmic adaptor subunit [Pseudomonadota bacterium]
MKTTPLIQAEIQTDTATVEAKPAPHHQVPASESSSQPLAWNSRTRKAAMKKPLVRRLVEESWIVGVALAALITAGCEKKKEGADAPAPSTSAKAEGGAVIFPAGSPQLASVSVEAVEDTRTTKLRVHGRLVWDETVTARVFTPFAGRVTAIPGEVGKPIEKGGPLAMIASPDFGQAQADVRRAASDVRQAERTLARLKELFEHGAAPRKDVETAESDLARAQSEQERGLARLALYGGSMGTIDQVIALKSPLTGVIVEKNLNPGQEVRPDQMLAGLPQYGAPLFVITDPTRLWVLLDASEADLCHLKPSLPMVIRSQASPEASHPGRLEVVSDSFDPATRMLRVRGSVENADRTLRAEMLVTAEIEVPVATPRSVTSRAVFLKGDRHYVYVEEGQGRFRRREVKVGAEVAGKLPIIEGLDAGQRVVTGGALLLEQVATDSAGS